MHPQSQTRKLMTLTPQARSHTNTKTRTPDILNREVRVPLGIGRSFCPSTGAAGPLEGKLANPSMPLSFRVQFVF